MTKNILCAIVAVNSRIFYWDLLWWQRNCKAFTQIPKILMTLLSPRNAQNSKSASLISHHCFANFAWKPVGSYSCWIILIVYLTVYQKNVDPQQKVSSLIPWWSFYILKLLECSHRFFLLLGSRSDKRKSCISHRTDKARLFRRLTFVTHSLQTLKYIVDNFKCLLNIFAFVAVISVINLLLPKCTTI